MTETAGVIAPAASGREILTFMAGPERILVTRSFLPSLNEYTEELRSIFETHWLTNMGEKHLRLEEALKAYLGTDTICLFQNGHLALELSLEAMGITGEVITTPYTFASTTWAILRAGCVPVFCDIDPETLCMDPAGIEPLITERTSAILPVHVYGRLCDVEAIQKIADRHHLKVIYDAAHAFGTAYKGKGAACFGDLSMFSFHATKVFHTIEGGAVSFRDPALADRLFRIKNFGIQENETYMVGGNAKMNEFEAAMGLCNLRHMDEILSGRKRVKEQYLAELSDVPGLTLPKPQEGVTENYAYFPVLFDPDIYGEDRDSAAGRMNAEGIFPRKYFWPCTNAFSFLKEAAAMPGVPADIKGRLDPGRTPAAERISSQVLTLPIYPELPEETVSKICRIIKKRT